MKIIDNFLEEDYDHILENLLFKTNWEYCRSKTFGNNHESSSLYDYQFVHIFYDAYLEGYSGSYNLLRPLLNKFDDDYGVRSYHRIKANLQLAQPHRIYSDYHHDFVSAVSGNPAKHMMVGIYYLNTNDGYTEFYDGTIVESVANRLVLFPNSMSHRAVSQLDEKERVVLNFNLYIPDTPL